MALNIACCALYAQVEVFRDSDGRVIRIEGTTQDISERVSVENRMRNMADYDSLTGLANRTMFGEVMEHALRHCARHASSAAVLDINIDRFNRINETLGHDIGDQVLREMARRIGDCIRASDFAATGRSGSPAGVPARMNGDSFAVFLSEIARSEDAALIARRLHAAITRPLRCGLHDLVFTASIGIAVYPDNGADAGTLRKNAETATRRAKEHGAGSSCFFTPEMNDKATARLDAENELRVAIERGELVLFYQPRVDVPAGRLAGVEALVRWQHPQRGLVPPNEFIAIAEASGLIAPLTQWVVRAACRQLAQWQCAGLAVVPVSVNLSACSFRHDGLRDMVAGALREYAIAPSLLEGEITESMLMQDVERAVIRLEELRALGMELAMDDFGTGYSSLAYLKRFPLSVLKIDRAFIKDVLTDPHDAAIASTIITLGNTMGMAVVAEGMEQVEQANFLLARGCRFMQGYLFARPLPADACAEMLRTGIVMPQGLRMNPLQLPAPADAPDSPGARLVTVAN
jgi:diguanylate cyclase (GGDEF)-like protein